MWAKCKAESVDVWQKPLKKATIQLNPKPNAGFGTHI